MTFLDRIEKALEPLKVELITHCISCGETLGLYSWPLPVLNARLCWNCANWDDEDEEDEPE